MKLILALAVLATSAASLASSRDIYDVMYLPSAGKTYGFSEATYVSGKADGKSKDLGGGSTAEGLNYDVKGYTIQQTIGHAFSDRFSLQASLNYANNRINFADDSHNQERKGISDPTITARFRAMDENFRLDFFGGALVSLKKAEIKNNEDRNNLQGGHALFAGAQFGQKTETFQWALLGRFTYNMDRTFETTGSDLDIDSNNELLLRADFLNKLADKSFLRYFVSANFAQRQDADVSTASTFEAASSNYTAGAEYQHLFSADLLGRIGTSYNIKNQDSSYSEDFKSWNFTVAANYQF